MSYSRASEVPLTLSPSQWEMIQALLHSAGQRQEGDPWTGWAKQIINGIEAAKLEASRLNNKQVSYTLSPSNWRSVQSLLRPSSLSERRLPSELDSR